jgi:small subunit ribosomal protein S16
MLTIRLRRMGTKKKPFYRLVVSDSRRRPTGSVVDSLGVYDPTREPVRLAVNLERADEWARKGARASETARQLIERARKSARV